ncbi:hypothetical protein RBU49_05120 [Clostridium sp. MB40-C1]|uniref:hypothetical protein n=1 Tax=Clostridium sp. MB40-C1 TaxID=3070996 RepID=UPI0027E0BE6C|nr:hypothetical protein [Clostridium sp. MB40-C1]WMJ81631.1 hypothetical protein RBU49_05120 [Clostridium sp. MB40-C1]
MLKSAKQELQRVVELAKKGDEKAKENIMLRFKPFVKLYVQAVSPVTRHENDLIKVGMLAVLNAIQSYDINKNNFVEYVEGLIKNSFKHAMEK